MFEQILLYVLVSLVVCGNVWIYYRRKSEMRESSSKAMMGLCEAKNCLLDNDDERNKGTHLFILSRDHFFFFLR